MRAVGKFWKAESGSLRSSRRRTYSEAKWTGRVYPCVSGKQKYSLERKTKNLSRVKMGE